MAFEHYIHSDGKKLRLGYTTGTCAALAASGAVYGLLTGHIPEHLRLITPKGIAVTVRPVSCRIRYPEKQSALPCLAQCGVRKDAGDDLDVTDQLLILARAERWDCPAGASLEDRVVIRGGAGVGRVTKPGLNQKVGEAAINQVPREMIRREVLHVCKAQGYEGGIRITILVPDGEKVAAKTLNDRLGIVGGISIIGTSGIVEPMSMKAYADSVRLLIRQAAASGSELEDGRMQDHGSALEDGRMQDHGSALEDGRMQDHGSALEDGRMQDHGSALEDDRVQEHASVQVYKNVRRKISGALILTPGNYGLDYLRCQGYDSMDIPVIVCSNYIGEALDEAVADGFTDILLVGHAGKLVKLAAGIMNTHSSIADGRCEIFTAHAALAGADTQTCRRLMAAVSTDACIGILEEAGLKDAVMASILGKAQSCLSQRCRDARCGLVMFSNEYGELGKTSQAIAILETWMPDGIA